MQAICLLQMGRILTLEIKATANLIFLNILIKLGILLIAFPISVSRKKMMELIQVIKI